MKLEKNQRILVMKITKSRIEAYIKERDELHSAVEKFLRVVRPGSFGDDDSLVDLELSTDGKTVEVCVEVAPRCESCGEREESFFRIPVEDLGEDPSVVKARYLENTIRAREKEIKESAEGKC